MSTKLVSYVRVSTRRQGDSGLGLAAQTAAVESYARAAGAEIVATFTEIESGKHSDRPELAKALASARRGKSRLCIAKLDRLSRNVAFTSAIMDSGVDFVACDNPTANRLTIHILAAVAEDEARRISERTKAALQAAKARGQLLGSARPDHWAGKEDARTAGLVKAQAESRRVRHEKALAGVSDLLPTMLERRQAGESLAKIADALNAAGHRSPRGSVWTASGVRLALNRAAEG